MVVIIELAFETFEHVIDTRKAVTHQRLAGIERALAATADQHHRRALDVAVAAGAAQQQAAHLGDALLELTAQRRVAAPAE